MSNSNLFNKDLMQTNLDNAYQFSSFSSYIISGGLNNKFSPVCIFCSSSNTINLVNDESFKQCNNCRKQFKAAVIGNQPFTNFAPYRR